MKEVIDILCWHAGLEKNEVSPETPIKDLGLDSIDMTEIVLELEEEYDVNIPDDVWANLQTVQDLIGFIKKQKANPSPNPNVLPITEKSEKNDE